MESPPPSSPPSVAEPDASVVCLEILSSHRRLSQTSSSLNGACALEAEAVRPTLRSASGPGPSSSSRGIVFSGMAWHGLNKRRPPLLKRCSLFSTDRSILGNKGRNGLVPRAARTAWHIEGMVDYPQLPAMTTGFPGGGWQSVYRSIKWHRPTGYQPNV